jgi:hypothetical protein
VGQAGFANNRNGDRPVRRWWAAGACASILLVATPAVTAASLVPLDPMYLMLYGAARAGSQPVASIPTSSTAAVARSRPGRWQLGTHSIGEFTGNGSWSGADTDELHFRPRFVALVTPAAGRDAIATDRGLWSQDVYAQRTLVHGSDAQLHVIAGVKVGGVEQSALVPMTGDRSGATLTHTAQLPAGASIGTLVGPMLGIAGDGQLQHHRLRGVFQQSKLYGSAELTRSPHGGEGVDGLRSGVESYVERRDLNVSVSELGLKYQYEVNDRVALGMGAMASVWWDLPDAAGAGSSGGDPAVYLGGMGTLEMKF